MNTALFKYALEVEKTNSISRAAEICLWHSQSFKGHKGTGRIGRVLGVSPHIKRGSSHGKR